MITGGSEDVFAGVKSLSKRSCSITLSIASSGSLVGSWAGTLVGGASASTYAPVANNRSSFHH